MKGQQGEWVQAPVTHEFRTKHTIAELLDQVDDLIRALENKVENEFGHLAYIYSETEDIINEMADLGQLQLVTETTNQLISVIYSITDMIFEIKSLASDLASLPSSVTLLEKATEAARKNYAAAINNPDGSIKTNYDVVKSIDLSGVTGVGDSIVKLNAELFASMELVHTQEQIKQDLMLNFKRLSEAALNNGTAPTAEELRAQLEYSSVDSREYYRRLIEYIELNDNLPEDPEDYEMLRRLSVGESVKGLDLYLAEYAELSMMKFTFDSLGMVSGMGAGILGDMAGNVQNSQFLRLKAGAEVPEIK